LAVKKSSITLRSITIQEIDVQTCINEPEVDASNTHVLKSPSSKTGKMAVPKLGSPLTVRTFSPLIKKEPGKCLQSCGISTGKGSIRDSYIEKVYIPESACDIERNIHKFLDS
jgi:hypothetical protein